MGDKQKDQLLCHDAALVDVYRPIVQGFTITLGVYYVLLTGAHLAVLKGELAWIMAAVAAVSAVIILVIRFTYLPSRTKIVDFERIMFSVSAVTVTNVTSHAYLGNDPSQFVYLLLLAFGISMIGPTLRIVSASLLLFICSAIFLTVHGPASSYITNIFTLITAVGGGFASAWFLHRSVRTQVAVRALSEDLLLAVGLEGKRNKALAEEAEIANYAKADFLANMSHELRTPLNGVVGIANALAATNLSAQQREMVDLIEKSGQTLTRLLSDILDLSKIEAGKIDIERSPFNLREEFNAAAFLLKSRAEEKGLRLEVTYGVSAIGWLEGDVTRIKQIITNLTSNAVKFTEFGAICVNITWSEASEILEIAVTDTGIGFDMEAGKRLFQRFVQADNSITRRFGGTGLGLSICRGLVDAMGGGMDWTSQPGVGSTFIVRLPAPQCDAPVVAPDLQATVSQIDNDDVIKILVAEDNATNQKVLSMILEPLGLELVMCENGLLALDAFKTQAFDVVLMDMQMPIMDGIAATKGIREWEVAQNVAPTPIIMLTANAMRQHRDDAKTAGADMHVTKPFTAAGLIGAIETVLQNNADLADIGEAEAA